MIESIIETKAFLSMTIFFATIIIEFRILEEKEKLGAITSICCKREFVNELNSKGTDMAAF